jgi:hypothetical protein
MLKLAQWCSWRKNADNVKAESGREFKTGKHQNFIQQAAIFSQDAQFVWLCPPQAFQKTQAVNFRHHSRITGNGIVIGESDDVQATKFGFVEDV